MERLASCGPGPKPPVDGVHRRRRTRLEQLGNETIHTLGNALGVQITEGAQPRQHAPSPVELILEQLDRVVKRSAHAINGT